MYFKAGAYNQCSVKDDPGFWYAACPGTGEWATDYKNGDYAQVSFSRLVVSEGTKAPATMAKTPAKVMPAKVEEMKDKTEQKLNSLSVKAGATGS